MNKFLKLLKLILLIGIWLINVDGGHKSEWYVIFYEDERSIHRCARDQYLEMKEKFEEIEKKEDYKNYIEWELNIR